MRSLLFKALPFAVFAFLGGCGPSGPPLAPVQGKVLLKGGTPLSVGVIEFEPTTPGPAARGRIQSDGSFELLTDGRKGAVLGSHRVAIVAGLANAVPNNHATQHKIPMPSRKYSSFSTSQLERTVTASEGNQFTFELDPE